MKADTPFTSLKILKHPEALDSLMRGEITAPITVEVDPTNACNYNCIWCMYEEFNSAYPETLSEEFLLSLVNDLSRMGVKSLVVTGGGEPLVNKATPLMIKEARAKGLEIALVTNGELMSGETLKIVADNCEWVRISLDAATADTYHRCHGVANRNAFQSTINNVRELVRYNKDSGSQITVGLGFLIHPYNYDEIYQACKLAKDVGADYIQLRPVFLEGFDLDERVVRHCVSQIQHAMEDLQSPEFVVQSSMERFKPREREYDTCVACKVVGVVAADMQMYICCQLKGDRRFRTGDLTMASFEEIWNDPQTHMISEKVDINSCPPCRYDGCNKILSYLLLSDPTHVSFI